MTTEVVSGNTAAAGDALPSSALTAIHGAALETLRTICDEECDLSPADRGRDPGDGVSGVIHLTGECPVTIAIGIPKATAEPLSAKFTGVRVAYESDMTGDLVGEMINVIAGAVAARLDLAGLPVALSLPDVLPSLDPCRSIPEEGSLLEFPSSAGVVLFSVRRTTGDATVRKPGNPAIG